MSALITILIAIVIVGLIVYLIGLLPIPQPFKNIAYVVAVIALILWLARMAGLFGANTFN